MNFTGFATSIFKNLYMDPPEVIHLVLTTLLVKVILTVTISHAVKTEWLFSNYQIHKKIVFSVVTCLQKMWFLFPNVKPFFFVFNVGCPKFVYFEKNKNSPIHILLSDTAGEVIQLWSGQLSWPRNVCKRWDTSVFTRALYLSGWYSIWEPTRDVFSKVQSNISNKYILQTSEYKYICTVCCRVLSPLY